MEQKSMSCVNFYANPERKVIFTDLDIHFVLEKQDFMFACTILVFIKIHEKFVYSTSSSGSFHRQGH